VHVADVAAARSLTPPRRGRRHRRGVGIARVVRVGVGCDRGLHRSVAVAEAATAQLARLIKAAASVAVEGKEQETVPAVEPEVL
jgi:hypothetical protein